VDDTAGFDDDNNDNYDAHAPQSTTSVSDSGLRRSSRTSQQPTNYHQSLLGYTSLDVRKSAGSEDVPVHDDGDLLDDDDDVAPTKLPGDDPGTVQLNTALTHDAFPSANDLDQQAHLRRVSPHRQQVISEHAAIDLIYDNIISGRAAYSTLAMD
jgi:hypothetical protein